MKESAFSLIETLVALLLLSVISLGVGQLLLIYQQGCNRATWSQEIMAFSLSVIEAFKNDPTGFQETKTLFYWQESLKKIMPGVECVIMLSQTKPYQFVITISCPQRFLKPIEFIVEV